KRSGEDRRLGVVDIQKEWNLEYEIALKIFNKLLGTGKFAYLDNENQISTVKYHLNFQETIHQR
ncbi:MAG: hypothetical protein ACFFBD_28490, partial [Candidatus Hodarchaeota archaeon]